MVHINAGIAGLVCCLVLGKRIGFGNEPMAPHNLTLTLIGTSLLWVGWFGFNAGSAGRGRRACGHGHGGDPHRGGIRRCRLDARRVDRQGQAVASWASPRAPWPAWSRSPRPAGYVLPSGALVIGLAAGIVCYWGATGLKHMMGYDDSLDVFGVHGVGGIVGAVLTGVFATSEVGGDAARGSARRQSRPALDPGQGHPLDHRLVWHRQLRSLEAARPGHGPARRSRHGARRPGLALHGESVA